MNAYYIKKVDIMQIGVPSTTSWMLARIIDSRNLVSDRNQLSSLCVNGDFNIKKAYFERIASEPKPPRRALWCNNKASPRRVVCIWQILQDRLPTKARLIQWGIISDALCVFCQHGIEDRDHLFNDCEFIQKVHHFTFLFLQFPWASSFDMAMKSMNKACRKRTSKSIISSMIWTETLYQVWLQRNAEVFGGNIMSPSQSC